MGKIQKKVKKKIMLRVFKSSRVKNLMELEAMLHFDAETKALDVLAYLTVFEGFIRKDEDKIINLQFTLPSLIEMALEMEELTKEGITKSTFENYTQSSTSTKRVTLGKSGDDTYFVNFERKNTNTKKIAMSFGRSEFLAIAKIIQKAVDSVYDAFDESYRKLQEYKKG